jgi:hypothetical protein
MPMPKAASQYEGAYHSIWLEIDQYQPVLHRQKNKMNANDKQLQGMCGYSMYARESFLNVLQLLLHIS